MKLNTVVQAYSLAIIAAIGFTACTKTEIVPLEEKVNNRIVEYKVINDNTPLMGAIDHINNTITVYRPYYSGIALLVPEIKLEPGAVLIDKDGNEINLDGGIAPVPIDTTGYEYSVLGTDKEIRTYALHIKTQVYPSTLKTGYSVIAWGSSVVDETTEKEMVAGGSVFLYGNFESTSSVATFEVTQRSTGKAINNLLTLDVIKVNNGTYVATLNTDIAADSGYYDIKMHHQGRTTNLPPLKLVYRKPGMFTHSTNADWQKAPGEVITLKGYSANTNFAYNATLIGLKRVYMLIKKTLLVVPEGFPESLYDTPIEVEIVSFSRNELKIKMPDLPKGQYMGNSSAGGHATLGHQVTSSNIGLYFDYEDWTGWGKDNLTGYSRDMIVK